MFAPVRTTGPVPACVSGRVALPVSAAGTWTVYDPVIVRRPGPLTGPLTVKALAVTLPQVWSSPSTTPAAMTWTPLPLWTVMPPAPRVSVLPAATVTGPVAPAAKLTPRTARSCPRTVGSAAVL